MIPSLKVSLFNKYSLSTVLLLFLFASLAQVTSAEQTRRSLVRVETVFGDCNGVLLNSTDDGNRQLVLTARHCFDDNFALGRFAFGGAEWLPGSGITQSTWNTIEFELLAESKDLDYALFELPEPIPDSFLPYMAGWNGHSTSPLNTYGFTSIGDSIVNYEDIDQPALFTNNAIEDFGGIPVVNGAWWIKSWEKGFTATGSSGAPLFDQWSRVVGVLSAGASTPEAPVNDFFSRLDLIFQENAVEANLDPSGNSVNKLGGKELYDRSKISNYQEQAFVYGNIAAFEISEFFNLPATTNLHGVYVPIADIDPFDLITIRVFQEGEVIHEQMALPEEFQSRKENYLAFTEVVTSGGPIEIRINNGGSATFKLIEGSTSIRSENIILEERSIGIGLLTDQQAMDLPEPTFSIFPNPVRNNLYIKGAEENDVFRFIDTQGKEVFPRITTDYQGRQVYNVNSFVSGMYLLELPSGEIIRLFVDN